MTLPPIVPGRPEDEYGLPMAPAYQDSPPPMYAPQPRPIPVYQPQTAPPPWNPGRAAGNTVVVLVTLFVVFCVLPMVGCSLLALFGSLGNHP